MHVIHHTQGFILCSRNVREADKVFYIYTRDFGLVMALAKAVRKLSSKLRYNLQDFYYVNLDLVRGREIWRVTHAQKCVGDRPYLLGGSVPTKHNLNLNWAQNRSVFLFLTNFFRLLRRLVPGEEPNIELFNHLVDVYKFLQEDAEARLLSTTFLSGQGDALTNTLTIACQTTPGVGFASFECLAVLRLLHHLGYIALDKNMSIFVTSILDKKVLSEVTDHRASLIRQINDSLKETQL